MNTKAGRLRFLRRARSRRLQRRRFLQLAAAGATGAWFCPDRVRAAPGLARVVMVVDGQAWNGGGTSDSDIDPARARTMIAAGLRELSSQEDLRAALDSLGLATSSPDQRYALKANCVNPHLPTHPALSQALAQTLLEASAGGAQVTIFDRFDSELDACGYRITESGALRVLGTDHRGVGHAQGDIVLSEGVVRLSRIAAEADHLISVAVLKNHHMAGVTLALKNHLGSITDPRVLHGRRNDCSPGIAELCARPEILGKSRLWVIDAVFGTCQGGLGGEPEFAPQAVIMSTDPVAADAIGKWLIDEQRTRLGLPSTESRHLQDAESLGLGTARIDDIDLHTIVLSPPRSDFPPAPGGGCAGCSSTGRHAAPLAAALGAAGALLRPSRRE